jgi:GTPase
MVERALLVRFYFDPARPTEAESLLEELGELVKTLGIEVVENGAGVLPRDAQKIPLRHRQGRGNLRTRPAHECDVIVIDNGLAPSQQREWEKLADLCVIDREEVILDIFAKRAQTREARLQVELARMQYALPRMARMWGHLDREGGSGGGQGGGAARGMGEKQIEVDRRLAHIRIDRCKRELEQSASSARPSARSARNARRRTPPSSATPTPANPPCSTSSAAPT